MNFKEILKKYWFVGIIAVLLVVFVAQYGANLANNKPDEVKTLKNDGKDVIYTIDGQNYYYADDLYNDLYNSYGPALGFYSYYHQLVDEGVPTTTELETYATNAATNILAQTSEDQIKQQLAASGFNGIDDLQAYCLFNLKLQNLLTDIYVNNADTYTQPIIDKEQPRFVSHILISVEDVTETTDENGNVTHTCNPTEQELTKLNECLAKLNEDGAVFADIASEYTDDPGSVSTGGALTNQDGTNKVVCNSNKNMYVPEFAEACMNAEDGVITDPVETAYGYHIIKVSTPTVDELVADAEFFDYITSNDPNLVLKVLVERTGDKGFVINDEKIQEQLDSYMEAK